MACIRWQIPHRVATRCGGFLCSAVPALKDRPKFILPLRGCRINCKLHMTRTVAGAVTGYATDRFGELAVRADAGLRVDAPEVAVARRRHRGVVFNLNEHSLPAQPRAQVWVMYVEAFGFSNHLAPPRAASRIARLTATRASRIF